MMRRVAVLTALTAAAVAQEYSVTSSADLSTATASATSASSADTYTHTIAVGKGGHTFSPDVTLAQVGDTIEFQFYPTNHSVVRAAYEYPCVPYEMVMGVGYYGFWSGWKPVDAVLEDPPSYQVTINDTDPIFFYCGAPNSCIGYQMVGVINPSANTSLERQKQLAEQSTVSLVPGEDWLGEGSPTDNGPKSSSSSAVPSGTATNSPASTSSAAAAASSSHGGLSTGAIAGIAIGAAAVLLAAGVALWFCGRQSNRSKTPTPGAAAQETNVGFNPAMGSVYGKPGHMSMVSGYSMPPNYDQGMRSPVMPSTTPVDPMMGQQQYLMHSGQASPSFQHSVPVYNQHHMPSMYAAGTHNIPPVEMSGDPHDSSMPRRSVEKQGVERYS